MHFNWIGLILAPVAAPAMFGVLLGWLGGGNPVFGFLFGMVAGSIISYGTMIVLFLPCLFLTSSRWPMTGSRVCLLGAVLGLLVVVPVTLLGWKSSGPDSGPPTESLFTFFPRWVADPFTAIYPAAGLITAGTYWWLGSWRRGPTRSPP
jgi:hypothetical protein